MEYTVNGTILSMSNGVSFDLSILLHDRGLLNMFTSHDGVSLRIDRTTGMYHGVHMSQPGRYHNDVFPDRVYINPRNAAYDRACHIHNKRKSIVKRKKPPEEEDIVFVAERTREQRDEEGRRNAITLEED